MSHITHRKSFISPTEDRKTVDDDTGEIKIEPAIQVIDFFTGDFAKYVQVYYAFYNIVAECGLNPSDQIILNEICHLTDSEGIVWLTKKSKTELSKKMKVHIGTVSNAITKLCKNPKIKYGQRLGVDYTGPILIRLERSSYMINPLLVHRGALSGREALVSSFYLKYEKSLEEDSNKNLI